jgi:hypothetical protein
MKKVSIAFWIFVGVTAVGFTGSVIQAMRTEEAEEAEGLVDPAKGNVLVPAETN